MLTSQYATQVSYRLPTMLPVLKPTPANVCGYFPGEPTFPIETAQATTVIIASPPIRFNYNNSLAIVPASTDPNHDSCPICLKHWDGPEAQTKGLGHTGAALGPTGILIWSALLN